jgi:hypothetical protein
VGAGVWFTSGRSSFAASIASRLARFFGFPAIAFPFTCNNRFPDFQ